jgi:diguanylate cyclase
MSQKKRIDIAQGGDMPVSHEPWLVLLSVLIAIQGSYVGLSLAQGLEVATGLRHRLLLAGSAITLAVGIWSMHFVGMLAAHFPVEVDYLVFPTLLSFLICVLVVGIAVFATQAARYSHLNIAIAALAMGGGIVGMHFVGMEAVHMSVPHHHHLVAVIASIAVAVAISGLALWLLVRPAARFSTFLAAVIFGFGIAGMHYTAMLGMVIDSQGTHATQLVLAPSLSRESMAILTTCVAFAVSAAFLLSLVPEKRQAPAAWLGSLPDVAVSPNAAPDVMRATAEPAEGAVEEAEAIAATAEERSAVNAVPLRGLGQPAIRLAATLPIQKEGKSREIPVAEIFAVRANAHYTFVFDGKAEYFCNWPISEIEGRLDPHRFMRVHRSHIVAIDRIAAIKRAGDHGMVELKSSVQCVIPVARARFAQLRSRVDAQVTRAAT